MASEPIIRVTPEQWDEQYRSGSWDRLKEFTAHYAIIAALIRKYKCQSILDLGCGQCILRDFIYNLRAEYFGIDIGIDPPYGIKEDVGTLTPMRQYDCIVFCESLYYMPEPVFLLQRYLGFARFSAISISVMPSTAELITWIELQFKVLEDFHLSYGEHEHRIFMLKGKNA